MTSSTTNHQTGVLICSLDKFVTDSAPKQPGLGARFSDSMTTNSKKALIGPGRFQWNAGGWFGSSVGSTAWMVVTACFLVFHGQILLAAVPLACFQIANAVGLILWQRRDRIFPFTALMLLFVVLSITIPLTWVIVASFASPAALTQMNWPLSVFATIAVFCLVPAMMALFVYLERQSPTISQSGAAKSNDVL